MHKTEPPPPILRFLQSLLGRVVVGGVLGYICTLAIFATRLFLRGSSFDTWYMPPWRDIMTAADSYGILLGALYYALAVPTLLEKERVVRATVALWIAAFVAGTIAYLAGGSSVIGIGASIGFWSLSVGMYRRSRRIDNAAGFNSYFR